MNVLCICHNKGGEETVKWCTRNNWDRNKLRSTGTLRRQADSARAAKPTALTMFMEGIFVERLQIPQSTYQKEKHKRLWRLDLARYCDFLALIFGASFDHSQLLISLSLAGTFSFLPPSLSIFLCRHYSLPT